MTTEDILSGEDGAFALIYRQWLSPEKGTEAYNRLVQDLDWFVPSFVLHGRQVNAARKNAYYGKGQHHVYYDDELTLVSWDDYPQDSSVGFIREIAEKISIVTGKPINSCLVNWYENGQNSIGWHSDRNSDTEGYYDFVVSVSLGGTRRFYLRKKPKGPIIRTELKNGDLCMMFGLCQELYLHTVPKQANVEGRISLTYRCIGK